MDDVRRDVQHAMRSLIRTPGFTVVVVITLAMGFGVNRASVAVLKRAMTPTSIADAGSWLQIPDRWSWEDVQRIRNGLKRTRRGSMMIPAISRLPTLNPSREQGTLRGRCVRQGGDPDSRSIVSCDFYRLVDARRSTTHADAKGVSDSQLT